MKRSSLLGPALCLSLPCTMTLFASAQTRFKIGVEVVRLDVSVTRGGQPVGGLSAADFTVTDNGVPQQVEVEVDSLPLSVLLVLDTSGSVAGERLSHLVKAAMALVVALRPGDRAALVTFSHDVRVRVPLTADVGRLASVLSSLAGRGQTAIRDAVFAALQLRPDDDSRPVVLVFSDGRDNASFLSAADTLTAARRAGVVVHAISLGDEEPAELVRPGLPVPSFRQDAVTSTFIERLVTAAGGRQWQATASADLQPLFLRALAEMRARYLLSFYTRGAASEGWHDLKVTLTRTRGDITARPGYFVPGTN
jgi:Ca-activated chloride channel family protein